jgi:hypothetical protein
VKFPWTTESTPKTVRLPLALDPAPEWTPDDAADLCRFLGSRAGNKLRLLMLHDLYERALDARERGPYAQGVEAGKNLELGRILALAETRADTEEGA